MESRDIAARRMHNQRLWGAPFDTPEEVVRWLGALQAQEFPVAKWSVAQRARDVTDAAMDQAFADGAILRTHILRPTWHFVLPADVRWMLALSAPRVNAVNASYYRKLELDSGLFAESEALLTEALHGGAQLTRKELGTMLDGAGITASGLRLGYIMMRAELDAVICSGAPRGKQQTYASFDERVPQAKTLDRDEALAELTTRYFTSRGPATLKDYVRWSGLTTVDCRAGLEMTKSQLEHDVIDGRTYWSAASSRPAKSASKVIDLVQGYDECIMSYSESKDVLRASLAADAIPEAHGRLHACRSPERPADRALEARAQAQLGRPRNRSPPAPRPSRGASAGRRGPTVRSIPGRARHPAVGAGRTSVRIRVGRSSVSARPCSA